MSFFKKATLLSLLLASPVAVFIAYGQPPLPPANVPIEGGVAAVIAACAIYGAKKLMSGKKIV